MRGTQPFIDGSYFYRYSELAASVALNAAEAKASAVTFVRAARSMRLCACLQPTWLLCTGPWYSCSPGWAQLGEGASAIIDEIAVLLHTHEVIT